MIKKPVINFILNNKKASFIVAVLGVLAQAFTIIIPVSIGKYYELAFNFQSRRMQFLDFVPEEYWDTIPEFIGVFMILILLRYVCYYGYQFMLKKQGELFIKEIKDKLFEHQMYVDYSVYLEKGIGKYLLRYSGDITSLKNLYLKGGISVFIDLFMVIMAMIWFAFLSPLGAATIVLGSLFAYLVIIFINKKIEFYSLAKRNKTSGQLSFVSRALQSIFTIILMNKQAVEAKKYKKKSNNIKEQAILFNKWRVLNTGFISFFQYFILALMFSVFYLFNVEGIGAADLISFILLYITILPIIRRLFGLATVYKMGNISLSKLNNIFELKKEEIDKGENLSVRNPSITFTDVDFPDALGTVNFKAKKNEVNLISVSKSISKKSIIEALTRVHEDYKGTIFINKENVKTFTPKSVRSNITVISARSPLLGRTVYEAITESRSIKREKRSSELLKNIQNSFGVPLLELTTNIGENGSNLSLLQYEILCFVRGINNRKKIVIVDEFSMLNTKIMKEILEEQKRTVLWLV